MLLRSLGALYSRVRNCLQEIGTSSLDSCIAVLASARFAWIFSAPLRSRQGLLRFAEDDFYYYLKIAHSFAWQHRITAFEQVWTNGFHPLYLVLLTSVCIFVRTLDGIYRFLWLLDTASAAAIFLLTRRIFARLTNRLLANALALAIAYLCIPLICCQMEVTLALPLGFAFLLAGFAEPGKIGPRRAALMGLLAALTFLARLDAALIVLCYVAGFFAVREYRRSLTRAAAISFVLTALPLPLLYLWCNYHFFGTLLPVSGLAKELRTTNLPSLLLFRFFTQPNRLLLLATMLGSGLTVLLWKRLSAREKVLLCASLLDPLVFYGLQCFVSDWPVWPWYFYALRFASVGIAMCCLALVRPALTFRSARLRLLAQSPALATLLLVTVGIKLAEATYTVNPWMVEIEHASGMLQAFAETHRGVYAMGDRAGMFLITTANPVLQVEGLTMDKAYLAHMRKQENLRSVLAAYGVNYYVSFVSARRQDSEFRDGCFQAVEPAVAGPTSMHMRSQFCGLPLYQFTGFDGIYVIYSVLPA